MRVITGKYKGRKLISCQGKLFRPTLDRVKESIFNVLGNDVIDSCVLDLFCGSGSLGIEALSRGAMRSIFVDVNKAVMDTAQKNILLLNIENKTKFILDDTFNFLESYKGPGFDIIFADPPYDKYYGGRICELVVKNDILKTGSIFVLERFKKDSPDHDRLKLAKQLKFGQTEVDFYIRED
jgi:16S rRNA (guanine966-N2)-methyltransferase